MAPVTENMYYLTSMHHAIPDGRRPIYRTFEHNDMLGMLCAGAVYKAGGIDDTTNRRYPFYCLVLVLKGHGRYTDDTGECVEIGPGDAIQRLPDRTHSLSIHPDSDWHEIFCGIGRARPVSPVERRQVLATRYWNAAASRDGFAELESLIRRLVPFAPESPVLHPSAQTVLIDRLFDFYDDLSAAADSELRFLQADALAWFDTVYRYDDIKADHDPLRQACSLLSHDPTDRREVEEILATVPLSYSRLRQLFRERIGLSPGQYRLKRRMEEACAILSSNHYSIKEIAFRFGYSDPGSFSRQFKDVVGCSPSEFAPRLPPAATAGTGPGGDRP